MKIRILLFALITLLLGACTTVRPGYEGVKYSRLGDYRQIGPTDVQVGRITYNPITTAVEVYPVQVQTVSWPVRFNGQTTQLQTDVSFSFKVKNGEAWRVFQKYGSDRTIEQIQETVVRNAVISSLGEAASSRTLQQLYSADRVAFVQEAEDAVNRQLSKDGFQIEAMTLTSDLVPTDERVRQQLNGILEAQNNAAEQRERVGIEQAKAEQLAISTNAQADAQVRLAKAQAEANRTIRESITPEILQLRALDKWNGTLPRVTGGGDNFSLLVQPDVNGQ